MKIPLACLYCVGVILSLVGVGYGIDSNQGVIGLPSMGVMLIFIMLTIRELP